MKMCGPGPRPFPRPRVAADNYLVTTDPAVMRALVVDHELDIAAIVCNDLTLEGFDVHLSRTGEDALVAAILVDPDVVVIDLGLPHDRRPRRPGGLDRPDAGDVLLPASGHAHTVAEAPVRRERQGEVDAAV